MVSRQIGRRLKLIACLAMLGAVLAACSGRSKADKLFEQGALLQKNQKFSPAIEKYEQALTVEKNANLPPNPNLRLKLADAYLSIGKPEQALQYSTETLAIKEIKPEQRINALLTMGQARLSLAVAGRKFDPSGRPVYNPENMSEAVRIIDELRKAHPDSLEGNLLQARIDQMNGRPDDAERLYRAILGKQAGHQAATSGLIEVLIGRGDYTQAENITREAMKGQKTPQPALATQLALSLKGQKRFKEAYDAVFPLIEKDSESLEFRTHLLAGEILINEVEQLRGSGELLADDSTAPTTGTAKAEFDTVVSRISWLGSTMKGRYPQLAESWYIRGVSYELQGSHGEALTHYQKAAQLSQAKPLRLAYALALMKKKDFVLARQELRNILRDAPGDKDARIRLAQSYVLEGDNKDALDILTALQNENPADPQLAKLIAQLGPQGNDPDTLLKEARAAAERGDAQAADAGIKRAESLLRETIDKEPDNAKPRVRIAEIAIARGDMMGALSYASAAARIDPQYAELEAGIRAQLGQNREAIALYEELLRRTPEKWELEMPLAELEARSGRTSDSLARYDRIAKAHPKDSRPVVGKAAILMSQDPDKALGLMTENQAAFAGQERFQVAYARMLTQAGKPAEAADMLARHYAAVDAAIKHMQAKPDANAASNATQERRRIVPLQIELALTQLLAGRNEAALATVETARFSSELPPEVAQIEAIALLRMNRAEDAMKRLNTLADRKPRPTPLPMLISLAQIAAGNGQGAIRTMAASEQMTSQSLELYRNMIEKSPASALKQIAPDLALSFLVADQPLYAPANLALIDSALARLPDDPFIMGRRVAALNQLDRGEEALAALERIAAVVSDPEPVLLAQADACIALADRDRAARRPAIFDARAAEICNQILQKNPKSRPALNQLAQVEQKQGRLDKANDAYRKLIEIDPNDGQSYNNLAWNLFEANRLDEAAQAADKAIALLPGNGGVQDTAGIIALRRGDAKRAVTLLEAAVANIPNSATIRHHYAQALEADGQKPEAARQLEIIALAAPGYENIKDVRKQLQKLNPESESQAAGNPADRSN